jgi:hypothetical protein
LEKHTHEKGQWSEGSTDKKGKVSGMEGSEGFLNGNACKGFTVMFALACSD